MKPAASTKATKQTAPLTKLTKAAPAPARRIRIPNPDRIVCPRCGRAEARIIGRSESIPVVYLKCDGCNLASVAAA